MNQMKTLRNSMALLGLGMPTLGIAVLLVLRGSLPEDFSIGFSQQIIDAFWLVVTLAVVLVISYIWFLKRSGARVLEEARTALIFGLLTMINVSVGLGLLMFSGLIFVGVFTLAEATAH